MNLFAKRLLPLIILFVAATAFIVLAEGIWQKYQINKKVLLGANVIFLVVSILVFFMQKKAMANANPNVFIRSIMAGMMIKMFTAVIAVLAYVLMTGKSFDKKAVFLSMFLYMFYLGAEVMAISKENRKRNV